MRTLPCAWRSKHGRSCAGNRTGARRTWKVGGRRARVVAEAVAAAVEGAVRAHAGAGEAVAADAAIGEVERRRERAARAQQNE